MFFYRYENRYEDRPSRSYPQQQPSQSRQEPASQTSRYSGRRHDNYGDTVPPGTEPVGYDRYGADYSEHRVVVTIPSESRETKRDREVRDTVARDWERTRDREMEQREKERLREYEEYHRSSYRKSPSPEKHRKKSKERSHERGKENKQHSGEAIEAISMMRDHRTDVYKSIESYKKPGEIQQSRVSVLVDLKREPSVEKDKKKDETLTPVKEKDKKKEKEKEKEKKKKRRDEGDKKEKKKKRKDKKEGTVKGKSEEKIVASKTGVKPIIIATKTESNIDPLYGDIEGAKVDKEVVENYGKVDKNENNKSLDVPAIEIKENVVLAPVPELSKWELDDDLHSQEDRISGDDGSSLTDKKVVTSEVLKRAENAIFQKAINAIRPIDVGKKTVPVVQEKIIEKEKKEKKESKDTTLKEQTTEETLEISPETAIESREARKVANSIQITIPSNQTKMSERSVEIAVSSASKESSDQSKSRSRLDRSKIVSAVPVVPSSPVRVSAKERLGAKVENDREEIRRVRSTVERKSRSRSPKRYVERKYSERDKPREISPGGRRVIVSSSWSREKDRAEDNRKERRVGENKSLERRNEKVFDKEKEKRREKKSRSSSRERKHKKEMKTEKIIIRKRDEKPEERQVTVKVEPKKESMDKKLRKNPRLASDRRKSALDEANFEPDYDETDPDSEPEVPGEEKNLLVNVTVNQSSPSKKRSRSPSESKDKKKLKSAVELDKEVLEKAPKENEKLKKPKGESEDSSESVSSSDSSSDSSVDRKKHRKKKKSKKRRKKKTKKRKNSSSDSDSSDSSSSDSDTVKKKKKHKHRRKTNKSKKRKKSKHK